MKSKSRIKKWICLGIVCLMTITSGCTAPASKESDTAEIVSGDIATDASDEEELSQENFEKLYDEILTTLDSLNKNSEYVGAIHSEVWKNVGPEDVVSYIENIKTYYNDDSFEYYDTVVATAFGVSMFNEYDTQTAFGYVDTYMNSLATIESTLPQLDEKYTELNKKYGSEYMIDDLKEYYLESVTYAEYACAVDGSYLSYNQTLNQFKSNISKLKKAAEIAN